MSTWLKQLRHVANYPEQAVTTVTIHPGLFRRDDCVASGRFAIVYQEGPQTIRSTEMICRDVRELSLGEEVYYRGARDHVAAMAPY